MKRVGFAILLINMVALGYAETTHTFLDGFTLSFSRGYVIAVDEDEQFVSITGPAGEQASGVIFSNKAFEFQRSDRKREIELEATGFFSGELMDVIVTDGKIDVLVTEIKTGKGFRAFWVVLKTDDKREYIGLAIDLAPSPGLASLLLLKAETGKPAAQKTALMNILKALAIEFHDAAG